MGLSVTPRVGATACRSPRAAGAVTEERERDTWDSLRLTPLDSRAFINGKLRGLFDSVLPYYAAYTVPSFLFSLAGGPGGVWATVLSLLTVWPLMYYAACCGLRASVQARATWRSLLAALYFVYVIGALLCFATSCLGDIAFMALAVLADAFGEPTGGEAVRIFAAFLVPIGCALALVAFGRAQLRLAEARALTPPPAVVPHLMGPADEGPRG
jgi:hypothetical protein